MSSTHLRAFLGAFVALLAVTGGLLVAANNGDADANALAAVGSDQPTTPTTSPTTSPTTTEPAAPPVDADQVLAEAQRVQAFADAVHAFEAEQAEQAVQLEALAQAENAATTDPSSGISDAYWDRMANCETGGNWSMVGSKYSGGLGFYNGTWDAFGGRQFAARAGQATRAQQVIVANRVANDVGLTGWGCLKSVGRP